MSSRPDGLCDGYHSQIVATISSAKAIGPCGAARSLFQRVIDHAHPVLAGLLVRRPFGVEIGEWLQRLGLDFARSVAFGDQLRDAVARGYQHLAEFDDVRLG